MFKIFKKKTALPETGWHLRETEGGLVFSPEPFEQARPVQYELLGGLLDQLEDQGLAGSLENGLRQISWDAFYQAQQDPEYAESFSQLGLPSQSSAVVRIASRGSLEDADFGISFGDWLIDGVPARDAVARGAILEQGSQHHLLPEPSWRLISEVRRFAARGAEERNGLSNREGWGRIRKLAVAAGANMDAFLRATVVLTPEKLSIGLRKTKLVDDSVVEIIPGFDGAPENWLDTFDRTSRVPARYDIPTAQGIVQVIISPKVQTVLEEIKKLDMRRVAGVRAQAFIVNPFAALGEDANDVIDEQQFEQARSDSGLDYERFVPQFERDALGYPTRVGLLIETANSEGPTSSDMVWLTDDELKDFVRRLGWALQRQYQLLAWQGYDLELQGDTPEHLEKLQAAIEQRRQPQILISYAEVYDLSHYASRVQEIGFEKPYYSPYIAKKRDEDGWFPDNVIPVISWTPEGETDLVSMPLSQETVADLKQKLAEAKAVGKTELTLPGAPKPIPVTELEQITQTFDEAFADSREGILEPEKPKGNKRTLGSVKRKSPVLLSNIESIEYLEERKVALSSVGRRPELPSTLDSEYQLLPHQLEGVAWLQTLFSAQGRYNCRGAILADDMGLGKTFQLLTLIAWALEKNPDLPPALVVAPVSLLENWKEEAAKFFVPGALTILTAYGDNLARLRVPTESIDRRLRDEDGLSKFLKPDWLGESKLVLTTYETLRDLEFSFAAQRWSIMVCDEAQKIKNPAAMVTRAAKKQNVAFRIACTGTPVENSLADIWCLFDFVQPGLLGALNDFGRRYRKPIEAKTEEEKARVEELRMRISTQILRRTKAEVATELKQKIIVGDCRNLPLSAKQRELYAWAIDLFKKRKDTGANVPFKNHLGLLHYLRLICTDPRRYGLDVFKAEELSVYRTHAPKLNWLLKQLEAIAGKEEKAIIFCEFRNIQRLLQHYIHEQLKVKPDIINGDTSAAVAHTQSRQKRIRAFQEKPGFGVIILSPVAVGFGVNIQAANHVIHYTRTWNPAKEDQATDRAYRIGQKKDVYVYYPVVAAEDFLTFDVKLDRLLETKRTLANDMLNGSGDLRPSDFDIEDVAPPESGVFDEPVTLETALSMKWDYFEALAVVLFSKRGYQAFKTPATKDNGVDVVGLRSDDSCGVLVQAKSSGRDNVALSWDAVKEVVSGRAFYAKKFPGVDFKLVCLTNQFFNEQALSNGALNSVEMLEQPHLAKMLQETPVSVIEVEKVLFTDWSQA